MAHIDGGLRKLFRANIPDVFWTSIESGQTGGGISDSNFLCEGVEGWVEYKQTDGWAVTLKPEQVGWILRRVRCGGRALIAVRRWTDGGPRSPACDELWLVPGRLAAEAKTGGLRHPVVTGEALRWRGGPSRWDWETVRAAVLGPWAAPAGGPLWWP